MSSSKLWVRFAVSGFLVTIPVIVVVAISGTLAYWAFGLDRWGNAVFGANFVVLADAPPVEERRIYGLLAVLVPLTFWVVSMIHLFAMFWRSRANGLIGLETIRRLRSFALFSALAVVSGFLLSGVMRWAMGRFDDAPLWTHLGFSTTHAALLFMAAIIFVASHIVEEGYGYKKETEDYV